MAGQIDLLGFINSILGQRQNESQFGRDLGFRTTESTANRALEAARQAEAQRQYDLSLASQQGQFGQTLANNQNQFGLNLANDQDQFGRSLANTESQQRNANLTNLSNLFGTGAQNMQQADILSMLAGNLGYQANPAALLNAAKVGAGSNAATLKAGAPGTPGNTWPGWWMGKPRPTQFSYDGGATWK